VPGGTINDSIRTKSNPVASVCVTVTWAPSPADATSVQLPAVIVGAPSTSVKLPVRLCP
jgi:hypothetical protein